MNDAILIPDSGYRQDLQAKLEVQRSAFQQQPYVSADLRKDRLDRLRQLLLDEEQALVAALMSDFGYRSEQQSSFAEVTSTLREIRHCRKNLKRWMRASRRNPGLPFNISGAWAEVQYQPLGVVGIISPWNFPVNLCFSPLAGVLAAGNRAMIKPSELTPATSAWMKTAIAKYFNEDEVVVCTGGVDVGQAFSELPFDHLLYTGGEHVARKIMTAAAPNLTPLTLELGGKSPVIIGKGANISLSAERIIFGKVFNAGQICLAPDTLYVHESEVQRLVEQLQRAAENQLCNGRKDFVNIINRAHLQRLRGYLDQAIDFGCEVIELGADSLSFEQREQGTLPITLVVNPGPELDVACQEIFGPVLQLRSYTSFDDVIRQLQQSERPLALYYMGSCRQQQRQILRDTHSGGVCINDVIMHYTIAELPFGGVGNSGMGHYHGHEGFKQFSHQRSVFKQSRFDVSGLMRPPYGKGFQLLEKMMRSWL